MKAVIDTNVLLDFPRVLQEYDAILPSTALEEIDKKKRDPYLAYKARQVSRELLKSNVQFIVKDNYDMPDGWDSNKADNKIIMCAKENDCILISNDLTVIAKASALNIPCISYTPARTEYCSYKELKLTDSQVDTYFHSKNLPEKYKYLILKDSLSNDIGVVDNNRELLTPTILKNMYLGDTRPRDCYQKIAIDSLMKDKFTVLTGEAGTAKTLFSLAYSLQEIEKGRRNKLVIIHNPAPVKGATQMGFYPGSVTEKLLQSSIGSIISSKLGGINVVQQLIKLEQIEIIPACDCRGLEVGSNSILYVTEAQNLSTEMIKLIIQRAAEGTKIIIEGDYNTQIDSPIFESDNGLRKVTEVFKDYPGFSHIKLVNIYRSEIAKIAEGLV